ncbi:MAG TPA: flagellar regulator YcgR PilZN domain-containing protein [Burkholderiales bacterium]|jgi:c-di-GMP-binding flagellar brake protein YcgR
MSRDAAEIARVLEKAKAAGVAVKVHFPGVTFESQLFLVDARNGRVVFARSAREAANQALLSRPRCTFHCEMAGWHIEFVAAAPRAVTFQGRKLIECRFPEILASNPRRSHGRVEARPPLALRVEADAGGIMPFDARIVDIGPGGVGFLVYAENIILEPGTVLRGCRIQLPGGRISDADLEVRYSTPATLPNGRRVMRSGCRFVSAGALVVEFVRRFLKI